MKEDSVKSKNKRYAKSIVSLLFTFLLSFFLFAILLAVGLKIGFFNKKVVLDELNRSNYYDNVRTSFLENVKSDLLPTGISDVILEDVVGITKVYGDVNSTIEAQLNGTSFQVDTTSIEEKVRNNIKAYVASQNIASNEAGVNSICNSISNKYRQSVQFTFMREYARYIRAFQKVFTVMIMISIIFSIIIIYLLIRMQRWKHRALRYVAYAQMASTMMIYFGPQILRKSNRISDLNVSPKYFYTFLVNWFNWNLKIFLYMSIISIIATIGTFVLIKFLKEAAKVKRRPKKKI